ncbi:extracellular catalytic domain type 1 short-chain-length polyhydroxyalkanoate depolymerase [Cellulomonas alba]|uniref:PHB depolymerase family esterase n=1 Tax=Cellulomonas alba TaxID=3053467 RepID=A0ABT7SDL4_9CELL|nr:PHB depolymerase family esterase [Cellulomonas alba]MDM7854221.1 PHB depolymerase family esterase [Cellulomonas alba]
MHRPVRVLAAAALLLVAPGLLAGCTSTSSASDPGTSTTAPTTAEPRAAAQPSATGSPAPGASPVRSPSAALAPGAFDVVRDFGPNPGGIGMYLDVPEHLPKHAPVLVAIHGCTDNAQHFHDVTEYSMLAEQHGFLVVYPDADRPGRCFDVSSSAALRHDGGSDPTSIANMVRWVLAHYSTDPHRVFVTGYSSGAMTTEVLLADYPDLFAAGSAFAGVPAGCFATDAPPPGPNGSADYSVPCSLGELTRSAKAWGDEARAAYPGYHGHRPRVQLWHGTADPVLGYPNLREAVKQWTDVLGVSATPVRHDTPTAGTTRTRYGSSGDRPAVEANSLADVTHQIPFDYDAVMRFFGLGD